jgi:hypothetical protein
MNCLEARDAMLGAEPGELAGGTASPLGTHLGTCPNCRAIAERLLRDLERLSSVVALRRVRSRHARRTRKVVIGAAAAGLIAVGVPTLLRGRSRQAIHDVPSARVSRVAVDIRPGQRAAVIATKDPKVTVVWIIQGGDH